MKIGSFHPVHVEQLNPKLVQWAEVFHQGGGPSWTAWGADERVIACAGLTPIWEGVMEGWCILRDDITNREKMAFGRSVKEILHPALNAYQSHRFQATVRIDNTLGHRFVEWLGMEFEGIMKQYGPDKADYCRYAWTGGTNGNSSSNRR